MSQTESFSKYDDLEKSTLDLLHIINEEDKKVPIIISNLLKSINTFIEEVYKRMKKEVDSSILGLEHQEG